MNPLTFLFAALLYFTCTFVSASTIPIPPPVNETGTHALDFKFTAGDLSKFGGAINGQHVTNDTLFAEHELSKQHYYSTVDSADYLRSPGLYCIPVADWGWSNAWLPDIQADIAGLRYMRNALLNCAPRTCTLVALWNTGEVYCCNDKQTTETLEYADFAHAPAAIVEMCTEGQWTGGQIFAIDSFNAVVKHRTPPY